MPDSAILSQFANVFRMSPEEVTKKIDVDFNRYFGRYFRGEPFDAYVNHARAVIAETGWRGRVLDVGCGFGVFDICLKASGASSVTGIDVVPEKVAGATRLVELMGVQSVDFREVTGEELPFSEGEFDGVLIKDTVSHLPANTRCYAEAFRVLRPGGSMLIIDDRNGLAPRNRWRTQKLWELTESGAPEALARRGIRTNFTELRLRYIRDHFPELSDEACRTLAIETRGFLSRQIADFVNARENGSKLPEQYAQCIHPENGMIQERLLNPFGLARELRAIGFKTKMLPPLKWRAEPNAYRRVARTLWPASIMATAYFQILATRPR
jgi:2-polyprenyl-3-methyl-5-hydroxy-6-metoxy-1,4-benzoquinol methylase